MYRFPGAALLLDHQRRDQLAGFDAFGHEHRAHLIGLATQSDDDDAGEVGVLNEPAEGPAQLLHAVAVVLDAAAEAVGDRHHAVDIRTVGQRIVPREVLHDPLVTEAEQFTVLTMPM